MLRALTFVSLLMFFGAAVVAGGCGKSPERTTPKEPAAAEHKDHDAGQTAPSEKPAGLSAEDLALAQKQGTCPVTGQPLGSMGQPVRVTVKGQTVFLCCRGCEQAIRKNPDKYLAKLKN